MKLRDYTTSFVLEFDAGGTIAVNLTGLELDNLSELEGLAFITSVVDDARRSVTEAADRNSDAPVEQSPTDLVGGGEAESAESSTGDTTGAACVGAAPAPKRTKKTKTTLTTVLAATATATEPKPKATVGERSRLGETGHGRAILSRIADRDGRPFVGDANELIADLPGSASAAKQVVYKLAGEGLIEVHRSSPRVVTGFTITNEGRARIGRLAGNATSTPPPSAAFHRCHRRGRTRRPAATHPRPGSDRQAAIRPRRRALSGR